MQPSVCHCLQGFSWFAFRLPYPARSVVGTKASHLANVCHALTCIGVSAMDASTSHVVAGTNPPSGVPDLAIPACHARILLADRPSLGYLGLAMFVASVSIAVVQPYRGDAHGPWIAP